MADISIAAYLAAYLAGGFALLAWMAFLNKHRAREAFWLSLLWPLALLLIPIVALFDRLEQRGWYVDTRYRPDLSPLGFRRRADGGIGWAVRCLWLELQVWKVKKAPRT